eukprot:TRINITY_DN12516_c0_g1_i1.p1 TRINITY_DN12516_c0_g1~~TRINITY_DN12516_c0_g1_i1.p1  ORF type:complete len:213 (-),score=19.36 TRINITY_DN12516_c0_g1_i1:15-653(-)
MLSIKFSVCCVVLLCVVVSASASDVVEITDKNYQSELYNNREKPWLIYIYAPWCGHCKKLAPTWEQLATNLKGRVNVGKIDGTANKAIAKEYKPKGFPSLYYVTGDEVKVYRESRELKALEEFATEGHKTSIKFITTPNIGPTSDLDELLIMLREDFDSLYEYKKGIVGVIFGVGVALGVIVGCLLGCACSGSRSSSAPSKSSKRKKSQKVS